MSTPGGAGGGSESEAGVTEKAAAAVGPPLARRRRSTSRGDARRRPLRSNGAARASPSSKVRLPPWRNARRVCRSRPQDAVAATRTSAAMRVATGRASGTGGGLGGSGGWQHGSRFGPSTRPPSSSVRIVLALLVPIATAPATAGSPTPTCGRGMGATRVPRPDSGAVPERAAAAFARGSPVGARPRSAPCAASISCGAPAVGAAPPSPRRRRSDCGIRSRSGARTRKAPQQPRPVRVTREPSGCGCARRANSAHARHVL